MRVDTCRDPPNEPVSSRFEMDFGSILIVQMACFYCWTFGPEFQSILLLTVTD